VRSKNTIPSLIITLIAPLLILMLVSSTAFSVTSQRAVESIYVDISGYIKREPWMRPGGTVRVPMMGEANTLNPFTLTTS
jgi:peptide/nickel transport system substrate-binding protein